MHIYVYRGNKQLGPFEQTEVEDYLSKGLLSLSDLAWTQGLDHWVALSDLLNREKSPPPPPRFTSETIVANVVDTSYAYPRASFLLRVAAALIDFFVVMGGFGLLVGIVGTLVFYWAASNRRLEGLTIWFVMGASLMIFNLGYTLFKDGIWRGQSIGKKACKIILIKIKNNNPTGLLWSAWRNSIFLASYLIVLTVSIVLVNEQEDLKIEAAYFLASLIILIIEVLPMVIRKDGRRLADIIARTQVVNKEYYEKHLKPLPLSESLPG